MGTLGYPGDTELSLAAELVGSELGWSKSKRQEEFHAVRGEYKRFGSSRMSD